MLNQTAFIVGNLLVAPGWLALVIVPRWTGTRWLVRTGVLPGLVAALYTVLLVARALGHGAGGGGSFFTLDGVVRLFNNETVVLIGWLHYLTFDLFVGSWIVADNQGWHRDGNKRIPHLLLVPILLLTLMYGPVGLMTWLIVRAVTPNSAEQAT